MDAKDYLESIKQKLAMCLKIISVEILDERIVSPTHGYFRARLTLKNNDFLEVSEYFVYDRNEFVPKKYRYQWMNSSLDQLIKRWDNAHHFPNLDGFPHHVHIGNENNVFPSKLLNIMELTDIIEKEIGE